MCAPYSQSPMQEVMNAFTSSHAMCIFNKCPSSVTGDEGCASLSAVSGMSESRGREVGKYTTG